jgi:hypothetical protein
MSSSPSLDVSLTPQLQSFIAGLVASGRYQTASEAVGQHSGCWKSLKLASCRYSWPTVPCQGKTP